jgi:hypothetical protein
MRNLVFSLALLLGGSFFLVGCGDTTPPTTGGDTTSPATGGDTAEQMPTTSEAKPAEPAEQPKDIVDTAVAADDFKTLVAAVTAATTC